MANASVRGSISLSLPENVVYVAKTLHRAGFEVYCVGGCVRNSILSREINDWDFTTNATPSDIQKLFEHTVYENDYGTVGVVFDDAKQENERFIEVTPYRKECGYSDNRRPDSVSFGCSLEDDLARRDFTINALAYNPITQELVDIYGGVGDLHKGVIRTVGVAKERFDEDALRMMRAVRIATQLGGTIDKQTQDAIQKNAPNLSTIAEERIRDEVIKILMSDNAADGVRLLLHSGILEYVFPEIIKGVGVEQNQAHKFDVFEHNVRTLNHACVKGLSLELRLSSLLHDVSKPETREWSDKNKDWTFYNHEVVGARVVKKILQRLKFPKATVDTVRLLVRWHMFFSDTEKVTLSGVRRMVARVGESEIWNLIDLRMCDRIGTGRPKEQPYRLRKYISLVEEVMRDPVTPGMLCVNGTILMKHLNISPGPRIGHLQHALLAEVLEDPQKNTEEQLLERAKKLLKYSDEELKKLGDRGKLMKMEENEQQVEEIRNKYGVE